MISSKYVVNKTFRAVAMTGVKLDLHPPVLTGWHEICGHYQHNIVAVTLYLPQALFFCPQMAEPEPEPSRKRPKEAVSDDINSDHFYSSDSRSSLEELDDDSVCK